MLAGDHQSGATELRSEESDRFATGSTKTRRPWLSSREDLGLRSWLLSDS
jgi:hypothetical protein